MKFHSKRFQSVRLSNTNLGHGAPLIKRSSPCPGTDATTKCQRPTETKTIQRNRLPLAHCLNALYASAVTCFYFILACLQALICQNTEHTPPQSSQPTRNGFSGAIQRFKSRIRRSKNSSTETKVTRSKSTLYSSDSEEEEEQVLVSSSCRDHQATREQFPEIDDYTLPTVRWIDNVIYFSHLYFINYPAFLLEFKRYLFTTQRVVYGHNLNPKRSRPAIIKAWIEFLKRREQREIMTRVYGYDHKVWVLRMALASRLLILFIQGVAVNLPQIFKHNNDGFKFTPEETYGQLLDPLVNVTLGGYVNWDAHYFLHISVYGYTTENILAFFPFLPMLLYLPSRILYLLMGTFLSLSSIVVVLGVILNTWLFVKCTDNIYELAKLRSNPVPSKQFITTACLMFCFNPASIFFSGLYTETLFAYLTSSVLLELLRGDTGIALGCAALSCLCRSNGILNVGFILALDLQKQLRNLVTLKEITRFGLRCAINLAITVIPFMLFQLYGRVTFCNSGVVYDEPADVPLYCVKKLKGFGWLPYFYIQKKYWNVGFLEYFQFKQLPNFLLATPVLYALGSQSRTTFSLCVSQLLKGNTQYIYPLFNAIHGLFLTIFCFLFIHVQVSTRMIMAACPYIYVYLAAAHEKDVERFRNREISLPVQSLAMSLWCIMYYLIGTIAFSLASPGHNYYF